MRPLRDRAKDKELLREMSFLEHLDELRGVLVQSLVVFLVASIVVWFFSGRVLEFLIDDIPVDNLNFFAPSEAFMARLKMSFVLGLMAAFPFVLTKVWRFVAPGLFERERARVYPFLVTSSVLFYVGVVFCYMILIPIVLDFLLGFGTERLNPMISVTEYFAFVARLCFTFGIVFQLPVIVLVLSAAGIVTPQFLLRQWRYAVLVIFVVAAVLTPPDPASQLLMALPVLLLYIGSVLVAFVTVRKKKDPPEEERLEE
jgi:sec-independent protein translocase protein TatC